MSPHSVDTDLPILGIDLGTTHSLVAVVQAGRPVLIPNSLDETLTPSAVAVRDGEVLVGAAARSHARLHPHEGVTSFKRDMGTATVHEIAGRPFTPPQLSALVLSSLQQDAERWLGAPVRRAVITVPAYFNDLQRQATLDAGRIAGLEVVRLINEPTAAAMAYGLHQLSREMRAVVLDLGGGTFDVTTLEIMEGVIEVRSSAGDTRLGGDDFTEVVMGLLRERLGEAARTAGEEGAVAEGDARVEARLWAAAERAKHDLGRGGGRHGAATVALTDLPLTTGHTRDLSVSLSRDEVDERWQPLLQRIRGPVGRALSDGDLTPSEVDEVLVVGGATRMPAFRRLTADLFGRLPVSHVAVDEVIAQGAALQAALHAGDQAVSDLVVTDVAPFTLGIEVSETMAGTLVPGLFSPVLERGTVIPASRVRPFSTLHPQQAKLLLAVYQGEHSMCRDNRLIGNLHIRDLPPSETDGPRRVDVRFTYDLNGLLEVEVTFPGLERKEALVLQSEEGRLTDAEVEKARQAMARLKFHPRDSLPNTAALAKGEELYAELRGNDRQRLGWAIHNLRAALEDQEPETIREAREYLLAETQALR